MRRSSQFELPLYKRGGRRERAGRKANSNRRVPHLQRAPLAARFPCHVALKVRPDVPSLRSRRLVREVEKSFAQVLERTDFRVVHYSIQSNHLHLIVEAGDAKALGRGMNAIGARLARAVNRVFGRKGRVLMDRFHHVVLRNPRQVRNSMRYVLLNSRRHMKTRPTATHIDPASSGRWFEGWRRSARGLIAQARERPGAQVCAIGAPHTWLLAEGWRKAGPRLDPAEIPGAA